MEKGAAAYLRFSLWDGAERGCAGPLETWAAGSILAVGIPPGCDQHGSGH